MGLAMRRPLDFLLPLLTPRTVFMDIAPADCALALRAASYVERVWCVEPPEKLLRAPCNLRWAGLGGVPVKSVDVAFSESLKKPHDVRELLAPGGVYFVYGPLLPAQLFREAGYSHVRYYAGNVRVPAALARISRSTTTAAYK